MKTQKIESTIISLAKSLPMVMGASIGLIQGPNGRSPVAEILSGQASQGANDLIQNYTFFEPSVGQFKMEAGLGVKGLLAGIVASKVISFVTSE